jgi:hypothetical protein
MVRIGRTVLALFEPVSAALVTIENAADETVDPSSAAAHPDENAIRGNPHDADSGALTTTRGADVPSSETDRSRRLPSQPTAAPRAKGDAGWSLTDALVMGAALCVLALSLAGLVWLLRG